MSFSFVTLLVVASLSFSGRFGNDGNGVVVVQAFGLSTITTTSTTRCGLSLGSRRHSASLEDTGDNNDPICNPLSESSFLSHAMLKVPSVDEAVAFWTGEPLNGTIRVSSQQPDNQDQLRSAFVELGCIPKKDDDKDDDDSAACFALELVASNKKNYSIGNVVSYIGVSLLRHNFDLLEIVKGESSEKDNNKELGQEPNGLSLQWSASAPGDALARLALKTNDLVATQTFYTQVLGFHVQAQDEHSTCLRYDNDCFAHGVPTTLVFEQDNNNDDAPLDMGDCLDHLAIVTTAPLDQVSEQFEKKVVFMNPTEMFGKYVMGVKDPNGYKVVIASSRR